MKKPLQKRKSTMEVKSGIGPKVPKKDILDNLTKQSIIKKYNELEENIKQVVSSKNNEIDSLKKQIIDLENKVKEQPTKSVSNIMTQTEALLDEIEYPCTKCIFVADWPDELGWHMQGVHGIGDPEYEYNFSCRICRKPFDIKEDLMYHIKYNHERSMPFCKYYQSGNCHFGDDKCWYVHKKNDLHLSMFKCGFCGKMFNVKSEFMQHRKMEHSENVKICINHINNKCQYNERCWYSHKDETTHLSDY